MKSSRIVPSLIVALFACGCAHAPQNLGSGVSRPVPEGTVNTDDYHLRINAINDKPSISFLRYFVAGFPRKITLPEGHYELQIPYKYGTIDSKVWYQLDVKPGMSLLVRHQIKKNAAAVWIEDSLSHSKVGKVVASRNEAILDISSPLDQSDLFTFLPPKDGNWTIVERGPTLIVLAKEGSHKYESYILALVTVQVPAITNKEAFIEFVKKSREQDTNKQRFTILSNKVESYDGRPNLCVFYHTVAQDHAAGNGPFNEGTMILEVAGYVCRDSKDKKIAVSMDYSHRTYPGQEDPRMVTTSHEIFHGLSF